MATCPTGAEPHRRPGRIERVQHENTRRHGPECRLCAGWLSQVDEVFPAGKEVRIPAIDCLAERPWLAAGCGDAPESRPPAWPRSSVPFALHVPPVTAAEVLAMVTGAPPARSIFLSSAGAVVKNATDFESGDQNGK